MKVLVIIPAYNEAMNLPKVISSLEPYPQYDYVIVNDGSKDNTAKLCADNGWNVLTLPVNMGLAAAFQTGMLYAKRKNYDFAIQIDGDGQHSPQFIPAMIQAADDADIVVGSRLLAGQKLKGLRKFGSSMISFALLITTAKKITDPTSGMRLYNRKLIRIMADGTDFPPEPDTLAYLMRCGVKINEIAVKMEERADGESYLGISGAAKYMIHMFFSILLFQFVRRKDAGGLINGCNT